MIDTIHANADLTETVDYARTDETTISGMNAVPARRVVEVEEEDGMIYQSDLQTFLIKASDLNFGAGAVLPEDNDKITHNGRIYVVTEPHYEMDGHDAMIRVFTRIT